MSARTGATLLGGLIRCGHCGANFKCREQKYKTRKGVQRSRRQYYCNSYLRMGAEICRSLPLRADWADGMILKVLQKHLCSPEALAETVADVRRFGDVFQSGFEALPMPLRQRIVRYFVEKIEILDRKKFRVILRAPMDSGSEIKSLTAEDPGMMNGNQVIIGWAWLCARGPKRRHLVE